MQPQQSPGSSDTAHTEAVPLLYTQDLKNKSARKAYKQNVLKERAETLFSDSYKNGDASNLIFFTEQPLVWHSAIKTHSPSVKKEGICNGWKLKVKEAEDPDSPMTSIIIYKNGTVIVQGNLRQFELDFPLIKGRAQLEKCSPPDDSHTLPDTITTSTPTCPPAEQPSETLLQSPNQHHTHPPSPLIDSTPRPSRLAQQLDIVILIDSNGKFLNEKKLFPNHKVEKLWCPNSQHAMELLSEERLGSQSHIIIHTGTNELRTQQERVSESLRRMIEKASSTFPNSRVVISTLLSRKDFHPDTITRSHTPAH
ncbi:hypothetical protein D5F01_LYC08082 [Larimichthys crocea]|uniref:Uncharacterized protein n=1 Tax=Larimichthys crocea TaxID=215358 RepID=A0A6G0INA3_LARCR|nr:hypothetical protein D5F01_LYC08082 [Larimichthys crocea]